MSCLRQLASARQRSGKGTIIERMMSLNILNELHICEDEYDSQRECSNIIPLFPVAVLTGAIA
jgi:hypothetical protein